MPYIAACIPLPQALLTVTAPVPLGIPAPSMACLAGHCFRPAGSTQPIKTSSTRDGSISPFSNVARIATLPSSVAATSARSPSSPPIGVLAPDTMKISRDTALLRVATGVSEAHLAISRAGSHSSSYPRWSNPGAGRLDWRRGRWG